MDCVVVVPTSEFMRKKIVAAGARVIVEGSHWAEADVAASELVKREGAAAGYVHAFDDERIWEGHASIVDQIREQMKGEKPDTIVLSVGGGGLLMGVVRGLIRNQWTEVQIIAAETFGADSLHQCVVQKQHVTLNGIESVAKSLGAVRVCQAAYDLVSKPNAPVVVRSVVVRDSEAVDAIALYRACSSSAGKLVEPACGASIAVLLRPDLLQERDKTIVLIVCGGNAISDELLVKYRETCFMPPSNTA